MCSSIPPTRTPTASRGPDQRYRRRHLRRGTTPCCPQNPRRNGATEAALLCPPSWSATPDPGAGITISSPLCIGRRWFFLCVVVHLPQAGRTRSVSHAIDGKRHMLPHPTSFAARRTRKRLPERSEGNLRRREIKRHACAHPALTVSPDPPTFLPSATPGAKRRAAVHVCTPGPYGIPLTPRRFSPQQSRSEAPGCGACACPARTQPWRAPAG